MSLALKGRRKSQKRRIICVGPLIDADGKGVSGQAMMFQLLIEGLASRGHPLEIVNIAESAAGKGQQRTVGTLGWKRVREYIVSLSRLYRLMLTYPATLYVTSAQSRWGFARDALMIWPARWLGHKTVVHQFGGNYAAFYDAQPTPIRMAISITLSATDAIAVEGDSVRQQFAFMRDWENKLRVVPNGLPERNIDPPPTDRLLDPNRPLQMIYLSNLVESKGYWDVLEAVRILVRERNLDVRCRFVGAFLMAQDARRFASNDEARAAFEEFVKNNRLEHHVTHVERLIGRDKSEAMRDSDVFVLPSYYIYEGQPVSVLEALAYGQVVIATRHRLIPSMVADGETGFFVSERRPVEIARHIEWLIDNPDQFTRMSVAARTMYERKFSPEQYIDRMWRVLQSVETIED